MQSAALAVPVSKTRFWVGGSLSAFVALFLLFASVIHLMRIAPVVEASAKLGFPVSLAVPLGVIELVCLLLYVGPRTSVLGATLLTGYLGGAVALHLRVGSPLLSQALFPVYVGVMVWGGLYLRDDRLRALLPMRS
jgi:hypothetical protein